MMSWLWKHLTMIFYRILGYIPWIKEGHWVHGSWKNYLNSEYKKSIVKFGKP